MAMKSQEIKLDSRKTLSYIMLMYNVFSVMEMKNLTSQGTSVIISSRIYFSNINSKVGYK